MTLHVLNGDSTAATFAQSGLGGEVVVWRECLAEGPLLTNQSNEEEFWALRETWINQNFGERLPQTHSYQQQVVAEFEKLCHFQAYRKVVFWFDHDWFCQANLLFLLAWFHRVNPGHTSLHMISLGQWLQVPYFKGLGQLSVEHLVELATDTICLTAEDLATAAVLWTAFAGRDLKTLITYVLSSAPNQLHYLSRALHAYLVLQARDLYGLDLIDNRLLQLASQVGMTQQKLVATWLREDNIFGYGDWSVQDRLHRLLGQGLLIQSGSDQLMLAPHKSLPTDTRFALLTHTL